MTKRKEILNPVTYIGACGCKLTKKQTVRKRGVGAICIEHKEKITHAFRKCADCDEVIKLTRNSMGAFCGYRRCVACKTVREYEVHHKSYKKAAAKKKIYNHKKGISNGLWSIDSRGDYCRFMPVCLLEHKILKCADCDKFSGIFRWNDPVKLEQFAI